MCLTVFIELIGSARRNDTRALMEAIGGGGEDSVCALVFVRDVIATLRMTE